MDDDYEDARATLIANLDDAVAELYALYLAAGDDKAKAKASVRQDVETALSNIAR